MFDGEIQGYQSEGGASEFSKLTDDEYFGGYFPEEDGMTGGAAAAGSTGEVVDDNSLKNLINTFNPFIIMGIHDNDTDLQTKYEEKILEIVYEKINSINNDSDKKVPYFFALINDIIVSSLFFLQTTFGNEYKKLNNIVEKKTNTTSENTEGENTEPVEGTNEEQNNEKLEKIKNFLSKYKSYLISPPENSPVLSTIGVLIDQIDQIDKYDGIELKKNDIEELVKKIEGNPFKKEKEEEQQQSSNLKKLMIAKINGLLNHDEGTDNPIHEPRQSNMVTERSQSSSTNNSENQENGPKGGPKGGDEESKSNNGDDNGVSNANEGRNLIDLGGPNSNDHTQSHPSSMTGNASSGPQQQQPPQPRAGQPALEVTTESAEQKQPRAAVTANEAGQPVHYNGSESDSIGDGPDDEGGPGSRVNQPPPVPVQKVHNQAANNDDPFKDLPPVTHK